MAQDKIPMTLNGKRLLDEELKHLMTVERPTIVKAIEHARSLGDLSENADYSAAKERQSFIEGRIQEINGKLPLAQIIDPSIIKSEKIVFDENTGRATLKMTYKFTKSGTYFPTLRVASQRNGDAKTPFARIPNLDRVRVVVE